LTANRSNLQIFSTSAGLRHAAKAGAAVAGLLGPAEWEAGEVLVRDMRAQSQEAVPLDAMASRVRSIVSGGASPQA
jgi:histidyl-tRNA synthetase